MEYRGGGKEEERREIIVEKYFSTTAGMGVWEGGGREEFKTECTLGRRRERGESKSGTQILDQGLFKIRKEKKEKKRIK